MTRLFDEQGVATATTIVEVGPCFITQVRTKDRDGYEAAQIGFEEAKKLSKPIQGHLKASGRMLRHLREVPVDGVEGLELGAKIDVSMFSPGERVDVTGVSKGRGFAGVMRRHGFSGGPKTHGQSDRWRRPGSIGAGTTPGRVVKGLKMAGQMGNERVTVKNLRVLRVDADRNIVALQGAIPGPNGGLIMIRKQAGA
jgi:large subunit ribosomal protein L3